MRSLLQSRLARYVIAVLVVWAVIFGVGYCVTGPTPGRPLLHVFGGLLLGMLAMYIAMRVHASGRADPNARV